jgi:hypothetical protein
MDAIPAHYFWLRVGFYRPRLGLECHVVHIAPLHCLTQVYGAGINYQVMLRLGANRDMCVPRLARPLAGQQQAASVKGDHSSSPCAGW